MGLSDLVNLFRSVDRLLSLELTYKEAFAKLTGELDDLRARVIRLESREDVIIEKARGAASAAASQVAMASVADIARRIGRLEERTERPRIEKSLDKPAD